MMILGKYLEIEELPAPDGQKTSRWAIFSPTEGTVLGSVGWFSRWRQYTFNPTVGSTFNSDCLQELAGFLQRQNADHREALKARK